MFQIGKVYNTVTNKPAKILWIESESYANKAGVAERVMWVLHEAFSENEEVRIHHISGFFLGESSDFDLLEDEYKQEFSN